MSITLYPRTQMPEAKIQDFVALLQDNFQDFFDIKFQQDSDDLALTDIRIQKAFREISNGEIISLNPDGGEITNTILEEKLWK